MRLSDYFRFNVNQVVMFTQPKILLEPILETESVSFSSTTSIDSDAESEPEPESGSEPESESSESFQEPTTPKKKPKIWQINISHVKF
jgi:hypothetical protein